MLASFCVGALEAIARYGKPEIMNTDQNVIYGHDWITTPDQAEIKSRLMAGADTWTTSSSNGSGGP
jgi:hypothetical protein